jgi:hypothetical protein
VTLYVYVCPHCPPGQGVALRDSEARPECVVHKARMITHPEDRPAFLPLDQAPAHLVTPGMVPLKVEHLHRAGFLLPETQDALEWLYRHRATNGMAGAFMKVGGRRCIDLVAFARLIRERRA